MIDFHTHILPNMDDGSNSVDTSNQLLEILRNENVKLVCLTSHFYPSKESIDDFLLRRNKSFESLNYRGPLELLLGSEVHYYRGISASEDIGKLCLNGTNLLLLELPFDREINDSILKEIVNLNTRLQVVLAHIERYDLDENELIYLKNNGVLLQANTEFIINSKSSKTALNWLRNGFIDLIGSDSHNLDNRRPNYKIAMDIIENKLGNEFFEQFLIKSYKIIGKL